MKRTFWLTALPLLAFPVAACGNGAATPTGQVSALASNSNVRMDLAQAQGIVQGCLKNGDITSRAGRKKIYLCLFPGGQIPPAFTQCATSSVMHDVFSQAGRQQFITKDLPGCLLAHR